MAFEPNNAEYTIVSDREIAAVLSYFTPDMIQNVLDDVLNEKTRPYSTNIGNLVNAYETNFKIAVSNYPNYADNLQRIRIETFETVMDRICNFHNIEWELNPGMDLYTAAFYTYQFLISNFKINITRFFSNFIIREKNNIYEALKLSEMKKNKDSSSLYSRKVYNGLDSKISVIHANLDYVLTQISGFDISLDTIIENVYFGDKNVIQILQSVLVDKGDFFRNFYVSVLNSSGRAELITAIRLQLQPIAGIKDYIEIENLQNQGE